MSSSDHRDFLSGKMDKIRRLLFPGKNNKNNENKKIWNWRIHRKL